MMTQGISWLGLWDVLLSWLEWWWHRGYLGLAYEMYYYRDWNNDDTGDILAWLMRCTSIVIGTMMTQGISWLGLWDVLLSWLEQWWHRGYLGLAYEMYFYRDWNDDDTGDILAWLMRCTSIVIGTMMTQGISWLGLWDVLLSWLEWWWHRGYLGLAYEMYFYRDWNDDDTGDILAWLTSQTPFNSNNNWYSRI